MSHHFVFLSSSSRSFLLILLLLLCCCTKLCTSKPINRLIDIAEKQKIEQMIEKEAKRIELLEAKEEILMDVVDALDAEIKQETTRLEQMKSLSASAGRKEIVASILEDYRRNFGSSNSQFRPG